MPVLINVRHELFAQAVAKGADLVAAYEHAGFVRHEGNASRLRVDEKVDARIDEILKDAAINAGITVERVTQEIANIAFLDIREFAEWGVREVPLKKPVGRKRTEKVDYLDLKPSEQLPERVARAIASVKRTRYGVEVKSHDKMSALTRLGTQLGMWKDKGEDKTGADALVDMIVEAHRRSQSNDGNIIEGETVG